jgi:hypothetical protein
MLFDLRARGRRRTVQFIYLWLAVLMGGGLVLFGIGGATNGGLLNALNGNGTSSSNGTLEKSASNAQKRAQAHPRDPAAWATLAQARYRLAGLGVNYDQVNGTFTAKGKQALRGVAQAWDRYTALNPRKPDPNLAAQMVQVFGPTGLNDAAKAVSAEEIVVSGGQQNAGQYARLAALAYAAGQTRKGDLSTQKALSLAPKSQRPQLKASLQQAKAQAVTGGATGTTTTP